MSPQQQWPNAGVDDPPHDDFFQVVPPTPEPTTPSLSECKTHSLRSHRSTSSIDTAYSAFSNINSASAWESESDPLSSDIDLSAVDPVHATPSYQPYPSSAGEIGNRGSSGIGHTSRQASLSIDPNVLKPRSKLQTALHEDDLATAVPKSATVPGNKRKSKAQLEEQREKKKVSHARKQGPEHIPRPRNAFILFRKHVVDAKLIPASVEIRHQNVSIITAKMWSEAPPEQKAHFNELARIEKEEHMKKFPGYRYQPVYRRTNVIRRRVRKDRAEEEKCKNVAALLLKGKSGEALEVEILDKQKGSGGNSRRDRIRQDSTPASELSKGALRAIRAKARQQASASEAGDWSDLCGSRTPSRADSRATSPRYSQGDVSHPMQRRSRGGPLQDGYDMDMPAVLDLESGMEMEMEIETDPEPLFASQTIGDVFATGMDGHGQRWSNSGMEPTAGQQVIGPECQVWGSGQPDGLFAGLYTLPLQQPVNPTPLTQDNYALPHPATFGYAQPAQPQSHLQTLPVVNHSNTIHLPSDLYAFDQALQFSPSTDHFSHQQPQPQPQSQLYRRPQPHSQSQGYAQPPPPPMTQCEQSYITGCAGSVGHSHSHGPGQGQIDIQADANAHQNLATDTRVRYNIPHDLTFGSSFPSTIDAESPSVAMFGSNVQGSGNSSTSTNSNPNMALGQEMEFGVGMGLDLGFDEGDLLLSDFGAALAHADDMSVW